MYKSTANDDSKKHLIDQQLNRIATTDIVQLKTTGLVFNLY